MINYHKSDDKFINIRKCVDEPINRGSVLLFKQENLCSASYERGENTSTLRVITLQAGRSLPHELRFRGKMWICVRARWRKHEGDTSECSAKCVWRWNEKTISENPA